MNENNRENKPNSEPEEKKSRKFLMSRKVEKIIWISLAAALVIAFVINRLKKDIPPPAKTPVKKLVQPERKPSVTREILRLHPASAENFTMDIIGGKTFKDSINEALKLIFVYDREVFNELKEYIYVIREGLKTDFTVSGDLPEIVLTKKTAVRSATWCAGAIAHQLYLAKDYYQKIRIKRTSVPQIGEKPDLKITPDPHRIEYISDEDIEALEKQADRYQIELMIKTGAPTYEFKSIQNRPPGDYSLTHDGIY
jgi:hypothetical protein